MSKLIFTPEQKEEAMKWYQDNCLDVLALANYENLSELLIDIYFKLKTVPFSFKPNEFIVGIEYKSEPAIRIGKEVPNVHINNPHKLIAGQMTHDQFALTILYNLFKQAQ